MRYISNFMLIFYCTCALVFGAAFTSTQTGDFNDGATWGNAGDVAGTDFPDPTGGDTFTIGDSDVVTIQNGYSTISSGSIGDGTLTVNGTLTLDGDLGMTNDNSYLTGTSGTINLGDYEITYGGSYYKDIEINLQGTESNHYTITATGGGFVYDLTFSTIILTWVDYSGGYLRSAGGARCVFTDCTFTDCVERFVLGESTDDYDLIILRCKFDNITKAADSYFQIGGAPTTWTPSTADKRVEGCTFTDCDRMWIGSGIEFIDTIWKNSTTYQYREQQDITFTNCAFYADSGTNTLWTTGNLIYDTCFFYTNLDNPHVLSQASGDASNIDPFEVKNCVFENGFTTATDGGDTIIIPSADININIFNNLCLDQTKGAFVNALSSSMLGDVDCYNNTLYSPMDSYGSLGRTESGGSYSGTLVSFKNNLVYDTSSAVDSTALDMDNLSTADQITYADYNAMLNIDDPYHNVTINGETYPYAGLGANDLVDTDPQFVDPTRNLAAWDAYNGGAGTASNAITEMLKLNDSDFDNNYTVAKLMEWVKAGFAPTNIAYATASDEGSYIGAVDWVSAGGFSFLDIYNVGKK